MTTILIHRIPPVSQHSLFVAGAGSTRICWTAAVLGLLAPLTLSLLVPQDAVADTIKPAAVSSLPAAPSSTPGIIGQQGPSNLAGVTFEEPLKLEDFASTTDLSEMPVAASQAAGGGNVLPNTRSARVAVARARQLMAYGAGELVERELRYAVELAPQWIEAQQELASWYSRQEQWQLAAPAWRRVMYLLNQQKNKATSASAHKKAVQTAEAAFTVARAHISPQSSTTLSSVPKLVAFGESSETRVASRETGTVRAVAAIRPTAQNASAPAESNPNAYTISLSTIPDRSTPVLLAQAPRRRTTSGAATRRTATGSNPAAAGRAVGKPIAPPVSRQRQAQAWPYVERATKAMQARNYQTAHTLYQNAYKLDPNNPYAQTGVAETLMLLKRYPAAEAAYRRALSARPNDAKLRRGLADVLTFQNKREAAIGQYKQLIAQNPRDFESTYQLAQILSWSKRYNEASTYFRRAAALQPNNAEVWAAWGEVLSFNHDTDARNAFAQALRLQPGNTRALLGVANLYTWNGEYPQAIENYRTLLARQPRNVDALVGLGNALTYSGDRDAAAEQYRAALLINPNSADANLGLGRTLVYARQFAEGTTHLQRALSANPSNVEALQLLAQAQANGATQGDTSPDAVALATYERLLKLQTDPEAQAATWMSIAQLRENQDNYEGARAAYSEAMRLAPANVEIPLVFAQSLIYEDQWAEARRVVEDVLRREPDNARALTMQVMIESKSGTPERAAALARRIQIDSLTSPEDALMLANALRNAGQPEAADRIIQQLAAQSPDNPTVALQVATAVRDSGQYESAVALYQRLIAAHPDNAAARLKLAETLIWTKQFDAAQQQVDAVLATDARNIEARVLLATINARGGTEEGRRAAEEQARGIIAQDPNNTGALNVLAGTLSYRKLYDEAITSYRAAVEAEPTNLEARLGLARNLYYSKQTTEAIKEYQELIRRAPADTTVKLELARVYLDQNELSRAEALFREIAMAGRMVLPPTIGSSKVGTIRSYARVSPSLATPAATTRSARSTPRERPRLRLAQAAPTGTGGDSAGTRDDGAGPGDNNGAAPTNGTGTTGTGTTGAVDTGALRPDEPAPASTTEIVPLPEVPAPATGGNVPDGGITNGTTNGATGAAADTPLEDQVAALRGLGEIRRRQNRYDESIGYFEQALRLDPADAASRLGLAQSLRGKGEYVRALAEVDRVVSTDNTNLTARVLRAQLLGDTGQPQQAQTELDAVVASLPEAPTMETYMTLAGAFTGLRNYDTALLLLKAAREDYPDRPEPLRRTGEVLTFARRWDEAEAVFNQLIAADPQDVEAVIGKARVFNYSSRLEQAEALYRQARQIDPENQVALIELGNVLTRRSNWTEAIDLYRTAIQRNPSDLSTRVELARVLRYNRQYQDSEAVLNQVLAADARYAPALTERGILRGQQRNYDPAIADLRQAVAITPTDTSAQLGLAEVLGYADQYDESIRIYQAVLQREPDNEKAQVELGLVLSYAGRYDEALAQLNRVTAANPQNVSAQTGRASVLARMRRTDEAIAIYRSILQTDPQNRRAQIGLAQAFVTARRHGDAIAIYDQLIAAEPQNTAYRIARARTLGYSRDYPAAIAALRTIVQAEPTNTEARLALAEALTNSGVAANRTDAIRQYQTVIAAEPENVDARVGLGRVYSYTRNYSGAERELRSVLSRYPDNPDALYALAETQRFSGQPFDARSNYERVLRIRPNDVNAQENLALVRRDTAPSVTASVTNYTDSNGVRLRSFLFGPTFPTRQGTIGLTIQRGTFEDDGVELRRRALNLLLARRFGPVQARLILSRVNYSAAPDKNLYDLLLQRTQGSRQRVFFNVRELDIIESIGAVQNGIEARQWRIGADHPLGDRVDLEIEGRLNQYSDSNRRTTLLASLYYRFRPTTPTFRIGVGARLDDSRFDSPFYYTPQNVRSLDALADYTFDNGRLRGNISASMPIASRGGDTGGDRRDTKTLFGSLNYSLSELVDIFINGGIVRGDEFDSNDFTIGTTVRF